MMKWLLIITLFGTDADPMKVSYSYATEAICNQSGKNYMAIYKNEGTKAEYDCIPDSPFVLATPPAASDE